MLIEIKNLKKSYSHDDAETIALTDVDLNIEQGEFVAIMGPSGSGKSTLMHILGLLEKATAGQYFFRGQNVSALSEPETARLRNTEIGFIFQAFNLLPRTSVLENVKLPLLYSDVAAEEHNKLAERAIASVNLSARREHLSNQLSGGEKQRVAIARALINNPSLILADEPTGNLDSKSGAQIIKILQELNAQGKTIIVVTHEQSVASAAKRIVLIKDGSVAKDEAVSQHIINAGDKLSK